MIEWVPQKEGDSIYGLLKESDPEKGYVVESNIYTYHIKNSKGIDKLMDHYNNGDKIQITYSLSNSMINHPYFRIQKIQ